MRRGAGFAVVISLGASGCVQIDTQRSVTTHPIAGEPARVLGSVSTQIVARGTSVQWTQRSNVLTVALAHTPRCKTVEHHPVERVETVDRTVKHGGLYFEYGAAAAALGLGIAALIRPQAFSPETVDENGEIGTNDATGYRIGGIFTAVGAAALGVAIYDTKRSRDTTTSTRAYAVKLGDSVDCAATEEPSAGADVVLAFGEWTATGRTDGTGLVTFPLPPEDILEGVPEYERIQVQVEPSPTVEDGDAPSTPREHEADADSEDTNDVAVPPAKPPPPPPPPTAVEQEAKLRLPSGLTVPVVFLAPYDMPAAAEHGGSAALPPEPIATKR